MTFVSIHQLTNNFTASSTQGRINSQGTLLLQDNFIVRGNCNVGDKERKVFLFEQSVVFSELVDKRNEELGFVFCNR